MKYKLKSRFLSSYVQELNSLNKKTLSIYKKKIIEIYKLFIETNKKNKKIILLGNGGSASICSHVAVDLSKNAKVRAINFNESNLITCLSNDYGYAKWMEKALEIYHDSYDTVVILSCSGNSKNLVNAAKYALKKKLNLVTITSQTKNNKLKLINKKGLNIWINTKSYNQAEIMFNSILLMIVDLIIGKKIYPPN